MEFIVTAIVFVLIFSVLVLIHEWGHFAAARRAGIKVEEFGFGLPPRIWGKKKGETLYSINAIPFGGFVKLLGEDSRDPKLLKNKRSFIAKKAADASVCFNGRSCHELPARFSSADNWFYVWHAATHY